MAVKVRRKFSWRALLAYIDAETEAFFPLSRNEAYRQMYHPKSVNFDDYFPSEIIRAANRLERKGLVSLENTPDGIKVKISDKGKTEILKFNIELWEPKKENWDGKWRLVFLALKNANIINVAK